MGFSTNHRSFKLLPLSALVLGLALTGCVDSGSSGVALTPAYTGPVTTSDNYKMPTLTPDGAGGYTLVPITEGVLPAKASAKVIVSSARNDAASGELPEQVKIGDLVSLQWKMYSLRTGKLIEDTYLGGGEATSVVLGGGKGGTAGPLPSIIHDAMIDLRVGDKVQVLFAYDMSDLPDAFNSDDAYTLMIEIVGKA